MIDWTWLGGHLDAIAFRTWQHVYLAALGVAIGFAISFDLALVAARYRLLYSPISALAGILYTIPSLALFAALISITGFSVVTAEVPLVLYTLVILVRNIVAGLDAVPAEVVEAADGMRHSRRPRTESRAGGGPVRDPEPAPRAHPDREHLAGDRTGPRAPRGPGRRPHGARCRRGGRSRQPRALAAAAR